MTYGIVYNTISSPHLPLVVRYPVLVLKPSLSASNDGVDQPAPFRQFVAIFFAPVAQPATEAEAF
jgi:hypothetical protein